MNSCMLIAIVIGATATRAQLALGQQPPTPQPYVVGNALGLPILPTVAGTFEPMSTNVKVYGAHLFRRKLLV